MKKINTYINTVILAMGILSIIGTTVYSLTIILRLTKIEQIVEEIRRKTSP
jgi:hypothetical protein